MARYSLGGIPGELNLKLLVCGPRAVITTVSVRNFRFKVICYVTSGPNLGNNDRNVFTNAKQNCGNDYASSEKNQLSKQENGRL